jgi:hypothetical protein
MQTAGLQRCVPDSSSHLHGSSSLLAVACACCAHPVAAVPMARAPCVRPSIRGLGAFPRVLSERAVAPPGLLELGGLLDRQLRAWVHAQQCEQSVCTELHLAACRRERKQCVQRRSSGGARRYQGTDCPHAVHDRPLLYGGPLARPKASLLYLIQCCFKSLTTNALGTVGLGAAGGGVGGVQPISSRPYRARSRGLGLGPSCRRPQQARTRGRRSLSSRQGTRAPPVASSAG